MIYYEVRFICYQYNCGGQIRNGNILRKERFNTRDEALVLKDFFVKNFNKPALNKWVVDNNHVHDGYFYRLEGIYKIEETLA